MVVSLCKISFLNERHCGGHTTEKMQFVNNLSHDLEHQLQLDNNISCCKQVHILSALAWDPAYLEELSSGH